MRGHAGPFRTHLDTTYFFIPSSMESHPKELKILKISLCGVENELEQGKYGSKEDIKETAVNIL